MSFLAFHVKFLRAEGQYGSDDLVHYACTDSYLSITTRGLAVVQSLVQIGAEQSSGVEHVSLRRSGPLLRQQAQIFGQ